MRTILKLVIIIIVLLMVSFYEFTKFFELEQKSEYGFQCNFYARDLKKEKKSQEDQPIEQQEKVPVIENDEPTKQTQPDGIQSKHIELNDNEYITKNVLSEKEKMEIRKMKEDLPDFSKK